MLRRQRSTSNRRVWQPRCRRPSLAGEQSSLWKMLSVHSGFTATMSTTILVHLAAWPTSSSLKIHVNIVLTSQDYNNLPLLFLTCIFSCALQEGFINVSWVKAECAMCTILLAGLYVSHLISVEATVDTCKHDMKCQVNNARTVFVVSPHPNHFN